MISINKLNLKKFKRIRGPGVSALNTIMCLGVVESNKELEAWNDGERRWEETWRSFIYKSSAHRLIKRSSVSSAYIIFINHPEEKLATHLYDDDCDFPLPLNPLQALFDSINGLFAWEMDYRPCFKTRLLFLNHYKICSQQGHAERIYKLMVGFQSSD